MFQFSGITESIFCPSTFWKADPAFQSRVRGTCFPREVWCSEPAGSSCPGDCAVGLSGRAAARALAEKQQRRGWSRTARRICFLLTLGWGAQDGVIRAGENLLGVSSGRPGNAMAEEQALRTRPRWESHRGRDHDFGGVRPTQVRPESPECRDQLRLPGCSCPEWGFPSALLRDRSGKLRHKAAASVDSKSCYRQSFFPWLTPVQSEIPFYRSFWNSPSCLPIPRSRRLFLFCFSSNIFIQVHSHTRLWSGFHTHTSLSPPLPSPLCFRSPASLPLAQIDS